MMYRSVTDALKVLDFVVFVGGGNKTASQLDEDVRGIREFLQEERKTHGFDLEFVMCVIVRAGTILRMTLMTVQIP